MNLGDRSSSYGILNEAGEMVSEHELGTTPEHRKGEIGSDAARRRMALALCQAR